MATLLCACAVAVGLATPASADPSCQSGGVLLVFARGSDAPLKDWSKEAVTFFNQVQQALGSVKSEVVQVGDEDGDGGIEKPQDPSRNGLGWNGVDPGEYPAVGWNQWIGPDGNWGADFSGYNNSRETDTNDLVSFLTQRNCPQEAIVLAGYSQGADVVAAALPRLPNAVIPRIAQVALYADPKFNGVTAQADGCWRPAWVRGNVACHDYASFGALSPRNPYIPSNFESRTTSWCDDGDGVCTGTWTHIGWGTHMSAYSGDGGWIAKSAPDIAYAAWRKTIELNPPPPSSSPSSYPPPGSGQKVAATKNQDGRLALFYVGGDSAIYYQYQISPGGYWAEEHRLAAYAKGIAATTSLDGRIELFYIGGDDVVYHRYQLSPNSHSWSGEERFSGNALSISAARNGAGRLELVVVGMNHALYTMQQLSPNSWGSGALDGSSWHYIPSWAADVAMTTSNDGRNEIFYVGSTRVLMHRWQSTVGDLYPNEEGFSASILKTAATRNQDGRLEVFAIGDNNHLFNKWQLQPNTPWYDSWGGLIGQARYLTAARNQDGRLELFFVGLNGRLYHEWQQQVGGNWSGESLMYGSAAP